jgi:hypothetical protein
VEAKVGNYRMHCNNQWKISQSWSWRSYDMSGRS